eukprot:6182938-Pleurochrysis_carterae.AAC.1
MRRCIADAALQPPLVSSVLASNRFKPGILEISGILDIASELAAQRLLLATRDSAAAVTTAAAGALATGTHNYSYRLSADPITALNNADPITANSGQPPIVYWHPFISQWSCRPHVAVY